MPLERLDFQDLENQKRQFYKRGQSILQTRTKMP